MSVQPPLPPDALSCLRLWVRTGEDRAFAAVVEAYSGLVFHTARQSLGGDEEGAKEVTQNVFLTAARKAPQLTGLDGLSAWFHSTTMKESANHRRSGERRRKRQEIYAAREMPGLASPEGTTSHRCPSDEEALRTHLNDALASLKPGEREILLSRFFENHPFTAIAGAQGSSPDAVRMKCQRAMEKLAVWFRRRGLTAESLTLGSVLTTHWSQPAPEHLFATIHAAVKAQAAASAAAAGTAPASLTAMASSKSLTAAAAVLLAALIPIHRQNQRIARLEAEAASPAAAAEAAATLVRSREKLPPASGTPGFVPFIAAEDGKPLPDPLTATALIRNWTKGTGARLSLDGLMIPSSIHDNMGMLSKLSRDELHAILKDLDTTPAGEDAKADARTMLIQTLLAPKDPQSALVAGLEARLKDKALGRIAEQWAEQDPAAAQAWLGARSRLGNLTPARFGEDPESEMWSGVTRAAARKDPAAAADWVQASLHSTEAPAMIRGLAQAMTGEKWQGRFLELAARLPTPEAALEAKGQLLANVLRTGDTQELWPEAGKLLNRQEIPPDEREAVLLQALRINMGTDTLPVHFGWDFAQAWALTPPDQRRQVLLKILEFQEPKAFSGNGTMMQAQEDAVAELVRAFASTDPARSARYIGLIEDTTRQAALRSELAAFLPKP